LASTEFVILDRIYLLKCGRLVQRRAQSPVHVERVLETSEYRRHAGLRLQSYTPTDKSSPTNPHQNRTTLQVQINQEEIKNISRPQKPTRIRGDAGLVLHGYSRGTSRSEPSPTAAGGPPAMRREIARRGAGRRRGWEEAAPEFGEERELDLEEEAGERGGGGGGGHQRGRKRERKLVGFVVGWVTAM
jgi:hypothetical protein